MKCHDEVRVEVEVEVVSHEDVNTITVEEVEHVVDE